MPATAVADNGAEIVFSDGSRAPKSRFSPASLGKYAQQIAKAQSGGAGAALSPAGAQWMADFLGVQNTSTTVTTPPAAADQTPLAAGTAVDLDAGSTASATRAPLLGQKSGQPDDALEPTETPAPRGGSPGATSAPPNLPTLLQQTRRSFTSGVQLSQDLKDKQAAVLKKGLDAVEAEATAKTEAARLTANELETRNRQLDAQRRDDAIKQRLIDDEAQKAQDKLLAAIEDYRSNNTINPNRYWDNMSTGAKVLAAIGQALGSFGSSLTRTENTGQRIIERAIDADVRSQEQAVAGRARNIDYAQNMVAYFRQKGFDQRQASAAARALLIERAQAKIDAIAALYKGPEIRAEADRLKAGLEQSNLQSLEQQFYRSQGTATKEVLSQPAPTGVSLEDVKRLHDMAKDDPQLKVYRKARDASSRFRALVSAGADGAAVMDFIATGLDQGSFTPTFIDMLSKRSAGGSLMERIRAAAKGGYEPALMKTLQRALDSAQAAAWKGGAEDAVRQLNSMGLPASLSVGRLSPAEQASGLGARPLQ